MENKLPKTKNIIGKFTVKLIIFEQTQSIKLDVWRLGSLFSI